MPGKGLLKADGVRCGGGKMRRSDDSSVTQAREICTFDDGRYLDDESDTH